VGDTPHARLTATYPSTANTVRMRAMAAKNSTRLLAWSVPWNTVAAARQRDWKPMTTSL
jgi:hypothetical protein